MPSKHALNVSLTGELCSFISGQVASGRFRTSSEVVRAALRLLQREALRPEASFWPGVTESPLPGADSSTTRARSSRS
jgi:antitoxin ParD1/3/4